MRAPVHPLFLGSWVTPVSELAGVLRDLASGSRKMLSASAQAALAELTGHQGAEVSVDRSLLTGMFHVWDYLRTLKEDQPDLEAAEGLSGSTVVWTGERFGRTPIRYTRFHGGVIATNVDGQRLRFDAASGELAGVAFSPFNPYLILR